MFSALQGGGQGVLGQEICQMSSYSCDNHLAGVTFTPEQLTKITGSTPYVINLYFHIKIDAANPNGTITIEQAHQAFQTIQNVYYPHYIYFRLQCIDFYSDTDNQEQIIDNNLGIHLFIKLSGNGSTIEGIPGRGAIVTIISATNTAHELGHCLGLLHTFQAEGCTNDGCLPNPELVNQIASCLSNECLNNSSCQCCTSGDFVCDTYATEQFSTDANCTAIYNCNGLDSSNTPYNAQTDNIMAYSSCKDKITSGQATRIRATFESTTPFYGTLFSTLLANINTDGYTLANFTLPAGNNIWDTPRHIIGTLTVPNNATLTISNTTIAFEGTAAGITVEKGGKLIIDHAILRDNACTATPWQGITVNGNGFVPHPANYLSTNSANHGIVIVKNGSVIENAQFGIYTSEQNTSALGFTEYTGGGIIDVQSSTLRNNLVGIHIGHFYGYDPAATGTAPANAQRSQVLNNTFINTAPYLGNPAMPYTHLYLNRSQNVRVDGNTFQCQANTGFTTQTRGTGVVATNTSTTIGSSTLAISNTFINLYKGVDIYNTLSAVSVTNVVRNQFLETDKAITLNTVPYATIETNIIDVKTGSATNDTYGILTTGSFGFDIVNNYLNSNAPEGNLYTKGIVVQQSYYTNTLNDAALTRDNAFSGKFAAATQIEGNCQNLQLQCSVYLNANKYDWYIAPNYPYLNNAPVATLLDEQGECVAFEPGKAFATVWHTPATGTYHIKNNAVAPITINYDIDSNPTATSGNVVKKSCSLFTGQTIDNTTCAYPDPANPPSGDVCCTNGIACQSGIAVARRIRYLIKQNDQQGIVSFLTCIDQVWAYRLLVATLIDQRQLTEALSTLLRIPDDSPDNIEFKATCNAVINNLLNGSSSGGRTNQSYLQSLRTMAQTRQGSNTLLTESYLAALEGNRYVRTSAPIEDDKTTVATSLTATQLTVVPNPAKNYVQIICNKELPNAKLFVYDLNGRLLKTASSSDNVTFGLDISQLPTGIYYCRIENTPYTAKLIVVK